MALKSLKLRNFRSYGEKNFKFTNGINLVIGPNGSGKTNLLESVYLLSSARSFRAKDRDMVRAGEKWYKAEAETNGKKLTVTYKDGQKTLKVNNKKVTAEKFIGQLPSVLFEPASTQVVAGEPADRRRFLNRLLATTDPKYLRTLINYKRVLRQRNALLRGRGIKEQLFAWDIKLVEHASYIYSCRKNLAMELNAKINKTYQDVAGKGAAIEIVYREETKQKTYADELLRQLTDRLEQDISLGYTTAGPHREDVVIRFKSKPASKIASRGEQRTITLALKLLELVYMETAIGKKPIVLMDDVFSELDETRRRYLLKQLNGYQTIITATDLKGLKPSLPKRHNIIKL